MTVIAWDNSLLVADGRCADLHGSLVTDNFKKLHRVAIRGIGLSVVALCGAVDIQGPLLEHLEQKGFTPLELEFNGKTEEFFMRGLAVTSEGQCYEFNSDGCWSEIHYPVAHGSGCTIAQHYLVLGKTAIEAVQAACKTELQCGGTITVYDYKTDTFAEINPSEAP